MNIKELTYYIQSANINFLIGSGASRPYLATLGSIEKLLTRLNDDMHSHPEPKYKIAEASIYKAFPTKRKFAETVLDYHFYELMRFISVRRKNLRHWLIN